LEWNIYNGPCDNDSADEVVISVFDNNAEDANAGEDIYLCAPIAETVLSANSAIFPGLGTWAIVDAIGPDGALTSGTFADINDPTTTISGLEIGIYTLTWSIFNGPCGTTVDTLIIQINDPLSPNATAGPDQEFCLNLADATMAGNAPLFPATGTWTAISFDPTGTIVDAASPTTDIIDIPLNEHLFVWTINNGACANGITSDTMSVYVNDITVAAANAGPDLSFCGAPDSLIMDASTTIGLAQGYWTYNDEIFDFTDSTFYNSIVYGFPLGETTFTWTVDNGACGITSDDITITVYDPELPIAYAGEDIAICDHEFTSFNLNASEAIAPSFGEWTITQGPIEIGDLTLPDALVISLGRITIPLVDVPSEMVWTVNNGVCGTTSDTIAFMLEDCLTIEIPDAFSPNGDGVNDVFVIPNLDSYPNHSLKIFNRWGTQVYEAAPYLSNWDGTSEHAATIGEQLPVSTYYYILDLGNGEDSFTGFVYLKR
jgi:gliding motility-associated-like protein